MVIEESHEAVISSPGQPAEVRVVTDPFRRALHLAFGIADRELKAADHLPDQETQLAFREVRAIRECRTIRELRVSRQGAIACAGQTVTRLQLVPALRVSHR
jgi:hypothetical protein